MVYHKTLFTTRNGKSGLAFSTHARSADLHGLGDLGFLCSLGGGLCTWGSGFLGCLLCLLGLLGSSDGLLPLGLADLGLLVPLGHDLSKGGPSDGPLELDCAASTLLCHLFRLSLLVLASVQHSPVDLSGVPLGQEGRLTFGVQELEHLSVYPGVSAAMAGVYFIPAETAQLDLHDGYERAQNR